MWVWMWIYVWIWLQYGCGYGCGCRFGFRAGPQLPSASSPACHFWNILSNANLIILMLLILMLMMILLEGCNSVIFFILFMVLMILMLMMTIDAVSTCEPQQCHLLHQGTFLQWRLEALMIPPLSEINKILICQISSRDTRSVQIYIQNFILCPFAQNCHLRC